MVIIGVDNGLTGAICAIEATKGTLGINYRLLNCIDTPVIDKDFNIRFIFKHIENTVKNSCTGSALIFENSGANSLNGCKSNFSSGQSFAIYKCAALFSNVDKWKPVSPRTWQAQLFGKINKGETKEAAERIALDHLPLLETRGVKGGLKSGRCDAACIAIWYAQKTL